MDRRNDTAVPFSKGTVRFVEPREARGLDAWKRAFQDRPKDQRYYELIEETLANDFQYRYAIVEDGAGNVRAIQSIFFVRQNLVEGIRGRFRALVDFIRTKFPRFLTMRVLMVGCAAGVGELDGSDAEDERSIAEALGRTLRDYARKNKASLVVFKDFPSRYRSALAELLGHGYVRVPSMPMTRVAMPFQSFDEYLQTLGYVSRKSLRRKFRKTERGTTIEMEVVSDIAPHLDAIYPLYLQVHERSAMKFEVLTKEFFSRIAQSMPERARFFVWRESGKIIAFNLCLIHGDTIYDECLGLDYRVALDLHLYFYTLRDVITWSIGQKLRYYCSGPLNYDPKLHLGHELAPLDLYVRHTVGFINPIFRVVLKYLEPTRHDPVLRKFPNADALN